MCQMISPERAVIWSCLHDPDGQTDAWNAVRADYFLHAPYRRWFEAAQALRRSGDPVSDTAITKHLRDAHHTLAKTDTRALRRMFKVAPPPRIRANVALLVKALVDRHEGRRVDLGRLIN